MKDKSTKDRLVEIGEEFFSKKGYNATSISDICERAGVSKGAFFHYFPTKESFFLEVLDKWLFELSERLQTYKKVSGNVPDSILEMTEIFDDIFRESKDKFFLFLEFLRWGVKDEKILKRLGEYFKKYEEYFSHLIEEGIREGSFVDVDPHIISRTLISFSLGTILQEIFDPLKDWGKISKEGIKLIISSIKKGE
ncbi:MAG TPA: TetR/AcrR family transcriptional regulator [Dictyoglomaceae bacterium]|nr:TetR/AcrR family transcriptional regulator [Dictyoglomaceae bacterium]HOL39761.1 TetR/AcrR family transcriptional regulator [Dictyoglomaceae bacterium]HPP16259.1 TetR/AcrR family transcriptional regulator [Dictyoglomaceae bacterium]HPU44467.1 TetR/AcrR family transcriptional regulator [Dictyoglomaceae bacterium]